VADLRIYVDLDIECLRPFDTVIAHDSTENGFSGSILSPLYQRAFFGRMGKDPTFEHSIPNAWMAPTPFHPFFILPLEAMSNDTDRSIEEITGPVALREQISRYQVEYYDGVDLVPYLGDTHTNQVYFKEYDLRHSITILPPDTIYPYPWKYPEDHEDVIGSPVQLCEARKETFDGPLCQEVFKVRKKGSHCITYWTHTW